MTMRRMDNPGSKRSRRNPTARLRPAAIALAALLAALSAAGCFGRKAKPQPPPAQPAPAEAAPARTEPPAEPPPTVTLNPPPNPAPPVVVRPASPTESPVLLEAEDKFAIRNYRGAIRDYEKFLENHPGHKDRPQAMFHLGLAYALSGPSAQNQKKAIEQFRGLAREFADSPYAAAAQYILSLLAEVERLKTENETRVETLKRLREELERIKKIDMERRPTKPPA